MQWYGMLRMWLLQLRMSGKETIDTADKVYAQAAACEKEEVGGRKRE